MTIPTKVGMALMVLAVSVDPTIVSAAVVTVVVALTGATVTIIGALTNAKKDLLAKADEVVERANLLATTKANALAQKVSETDATLHSIQQTGEISAKKVDGNLTEVKERLAEMVQRNRSLEETIATLTDIIKTRMRVGE